MNHVIRRSGRWLIIYLVVFVAVGLMFVRLPKSFLPDEDQGYMFVIVQTPSGPRRKRPQDARQHQHVPDHHREGCGRLGVHG